MKMSLACSEAIIKYENVLFIFYSKAPVPDVLQYLAGSSIKTVWQEIEVPHSPHFLWHLYYSQELSTVQTPQMNEV